LSTVNPGLSPVHHKLLLLHSSVSFNKANAYSQCSRGTAATDGH